MKNFIILIVLLAGYSNVMAQNNQATLTKNYNLEKNLAVNGYDVVSYFTQSKAVKGSKQISTNQDGVNYYFSSASNLTLFKSNPKKYMPQYGGWCAYAMGANAEKVEIDPETFKIKDGKLYLFYNAYFNNTLKTWNQDEANFKSKADMNWAKINK